MTIPLRVDGIIGDRAFAEVGEPVHAVAAEGRGLLVVGTGRYDGGYFFEGELLPMDVETGAVTSLIEHTLGRQVLALEWLTGRELRVLMAPPDDWQDKDAWGAGHVAVVRQLDWTRTAPVNHCGGTGRTAGGGASPGRPGGRAPDRVTPESGWGSAA